MTLQNIFPPERTFEHDGKTYEVRILDEQVRSQYEEHCYQADVSKLNKVKHLYHPDDYRKRTARLADNYCKRKYRLDPAKGKSFTLDEGLLLVSLLFQCKEDEAIKLMSERGEEVGNVLKLVIEQSFGKPKEGSGGKKKD